MKCPVYHVTQRGRDVFGLHQITIGMSMRDIEQLVLKGIENQCYDYVARFKVADDDDALRAGQNLYALSQNEGVPEGAECWTENEHVIYHCVGHTRSTAIGDLFMIPTRDACGHGVLEIYIVTDIGVMRIGGRDMVKMICGD